jgi:hypothetical protein
MSSEREADLLAMHRASLRPTLQDDAHMRTHTYASAYAKGQATLVELLEGETFSESQRGLAVHVVYANEALGGGRWTAARAWPDDADLLREVGIDRFLKEEQSPFAGVFVGALPGALLAADGVVCMRDASHDSSRAYRTVSVLDVHKRFSMDPSKEYCHVRDERVLRVDKALVLRTRCVPATHQVFAT